MLIYAQLCVYQKHRNREQELRFIVSQIFDIYEVIAHRTKAAAIKSIRIFEDGIGLPDKVAALAGGELLPEIGLRLFI